MRRFGLYIFALFLCVDSFAIPAKTGFVTFIQPDGTPVQIRLAGDEHGHVAFSTDGRVVVNVGDRLEYARIDDSGLAHPSGIPVGKGRLSALEATTLQNADAVEKYLSVKSAARAARIARKMRNMPTRSADSGVVPEYFGRCTSNFPVTGNQKGLVILVEYQDVGFEYADSVYFDRMLNEEGFSDYGSLGSAKDWFVENSDGRFVPQFDVFGPVLLPQKRRYYGQNDREGNDRHPEQMVVDACDMLDGVIDFSQYDRDGDGIIDNVFLFYAGNGEHDSNIAEAVWPHSWDFAEARPDTIFTYDGVRLNHYACTCEFPSGYKRPDGIGTFVHEFSHVLGLPDLYATSYSSGFTPGEWSVLDQGPYNNDRLTPPNYSSFEKCALGWIEMQPMEEGRLELPDLAKTGKAYALPTERDNEFYFFENRRQEGNDTFLPHHGMLVWHIDYSKFKWDNNTVNNTASHQNVDLIEADNLLTEATRAGDSFPGTKKVTQFTFETTPKLSSWEGLPLAFDIRDIEESEDGLIRFDAVKRSGGDPNNVAIIVEKEGEPVYYDLTGRRVVNPGKGIYIAGGKKVIVK